MRLRPLSRRHEWQLLDTADSHISSLPALTAFRLPRESSQDERVERRPSATRRHTPWACHAAKYSRAAGGLFASLCASGAVYGTCTSRMTCMVTWTNWTRRVANILPSASRTQPNRVALLPTVNVPSCMSRVRSVEQIVSVACCVLLLSLIHI